MNGRLIKHGHSYALILEEKMVAFAHPTDFSNDGTIGVLSFKNCKEIEIESYYDIYGEAIAYASSNGCVNPEGYSDEQIGKLHGFIDGFIEGFEKAINLFNINHSLDLKEWDVKVKMCFIGKCNGNNNNGCFLDAPGHNCGCYQLKPKLDKQGCLILERIETFK